MLFNSYIFILVFLPLSVFIYYFAQNAGKNYFAKIFLIGMSLWFYAYFHVVYLFIILFSVCLNYVVAQICNRSVAPSIRKIVTAIGVAGDIGIIIYYKYLDFMIENINVVFQTDFAVRNILMPLGISFFTFQQISYLIDTYKGETKEYGFIDYVLFVTFFPQLIAGPIVTHDEMIPQFQDNIPFSWDNLSEGIYKFAVGLGKKVLLADQFGRLVDLGYSVSGNLTTVETIIVGLAFTFQIYFDFSGYCDMASGAAQMFGIKLPVNFNSPYKSTSISDFWNRWHITLTRFFRIYIYFPLGGSKKGKVRTYVNILILFLISGIWHGAAWTYIFWGIYNGVLMVLHRLGKRVWGRIPGMIQWLFNFVLINIGWMLFRADSLAEFCTMARRLVHWKLGGIRPAFFECFDVLEYTYIVSHVSFLEKLDAACKWIPMLIFGLIAFGITLFAKNIYERKFVPNLKKCVGSVVLLVWSVISLSGVTIFLYFNF